MYFLKINSIWFDNDMVEIEISAKNKCFQAQTRLYTTENEIIKIGEEISEFAKKPSKSISFQIGSDDIYGKLTGNISQYNSRGVCKLELEINGTVGFPLEEGRSNLRIFIWLSELDELAMKFKSIPLKSLFEFSQENSEEFNL